MLILKLRMIFHVLMLEVRSKLKYSDFLEALILSDYLVDQRCRSQQCHLNLQVYSSCQQKNRNSNLILSEMWENKSENQSKKKNPSLNQELLSLSFSLRCNLLLIYLMWTLACNKKYLLKYQRRSLISIRTSRDKMNQKYHRQMIILLVLIIFWVKMTLV